MIETGVYFGNIHSFYDLDLILSQSSVPPAQPKTSYLDIPGADGSIDTTEVHGAVKYNDRDCKFTFTMNPDLDSSEDAWEDKKTQVANALNGIFFEKIILDKDSDYYYSGRCAVDEYLSNKKLRQIVVTAKVRPYKMRRTETVSVFSLSTTPNVVRLNNEKKVVWPVIECTVNATIIFNGTTFRLPTGTHEVREMRLLAGLNELTISGNGNITFKYREGAL